MKYTIISVDDHVVEPPWLFERYLPANMRERPADVLKRNFWFCTLDDPGTINTRYRIGVENILFETDYPHGDGTWPASQSLIGDVWGDIPNQEITMMCSENASQLYRHPLPKLVLPKD